MQATKLVFSILVLGIFMLVGVNVAHAQEIVPLEFYNAGYIKPGWQYNFRLHAFGMTAVPIPISHAFADAGIMFAGHKYGIVGDDGGGATGHVYYLIDNQQIEVDTYHYGKHEYDAEIVVTAYCPGEQPPGAPSSAGENQFWVKVEFQGTHGTYTRWNLLTIDYSGTGVPLRYFYEKTPGLESWVDTGEKVQFSKCGSNVIGPNPGGDTRDDSSNNEPLWKNKWLIGLIALILVALLIRGLLPW